ncbi:hypothetical protein IE53DRAFT_386287 [Violaceomyces palustris]|uniref:Uncharacterized protein n=1 Tax=Violaceomyces palustris TaxID=1673888 RepID=A0ACD0NZU0_9BASI|nr:hypothetical protein IE53DRAFT_386287 [Violaceomyces palustris]
MPADNTEPKEQQTDDSNDENTILVLPLLSASVPNSRSLETIWNTTKALIKSIVGEGEEEDDQGGDEDRRGSSRGGEVEDDEDDGSSSFHYVAPTNHHVAAVSSSSSASSFKLPYRISNRYYQANVEIKAFHPRLVQSLIPGQDVGRGKTKKKGTRPGARCGRNGGSRDVFEALKDDKRGDGGEDFEDRVVILGDDAASYTTSHGRREGEGRARRKGEEGGLELGSVPALILVVDRDLPTSHHKGLLSRIGVEESVGGLSITGFDMEISLVIGLSSPAPLEPLTVEGDSYLSQPGKAVAQGKPSAEDLIELYAEQGWEFVDLSIEEDDDSDDEEEENLAQVSSSPGEDEVGGVRAGEGDFLVDRFGDAYESEGRSVVGRIEDIRAGAEEERGLDRIRESLMTYMWPCMVPNDDGLANSSKRRKAVLVGGRASALDMDDDVHVNVRFSQEVFWSRGGVGFSDWKEEEGEEGGGECRGDEECVERGESETREKDIYIARSGTERDSRPLSSGTAATAKEETPFSDKAVSVMPNEQDEALARAFLAKLASFDRTPSPCSGPVSGGKSDEFGRETTSNPNTSSNLPFPNDPEAMRRLEEFLEREDPGWPKLSSREAIVGEKKGSEEKNLARIPIQEKLGRETRKGEDEPIPHQNQGQGFEDDFDDFVSAPAFGGGSYLGQKEREEGVKENLFDAEGDDAHLPSEEEVERMRRSMGLSSFKEISTAATGDLDPTGSELDPTADFERQLTQLESQALRVRSIQDPERRRREAALVAMAFGGYWEAL